MLSAFIGGYSIGELAILVVAIAAVVALVFVALRKFKIAIPDWVIECFWIVIVAIVIILCIRLVISV